VNNPKKRNGISVRLSDEDVARYSALADKTDVPLAVMIRRLLEAAEKCVEQNEGWPMEIAVVKRPREGAAPAEAPLNDESRNLPDTNRSASPKPATKRPLRTQQKKEKTNVRPA